MAKRRRFLALAGGALSTTIFLAGCLGHPPSRTGSSDAPPGAGSAPAPAIANADVETKTISLGFIPILEAAPLVIGVEKGFFAKHGLDVKLSKQANWGAARDNVVLGSAGGGIDGGQWQLPMPQMISTGALTNGKKVPMYVLAMLMSQGNGIAPAEAVKSGNLSYDLKKTSPGYFAQFSQKRAESSGRLIPFPRLARNSGSAGGWPLVGSTPTKTWSCSQFPRLKYCRG
jgi:bicarbonate transport system substrate-binding protein